MIDEDDDSAADFLKQIAVVTEYTSRELTATQQAVHKIAKATGVKLDDVPAPHASSDQLWLCRGCGTKLGVYAPPPEDILRIRYKDMLLHIRLGESGHIEMFCRVCGAENRQEYAAG